LCWLGTANSFSVKDKYMGQNIFLDKLFLTWKSLSTKRQVLVRVVSKKKKKYIYIREIQCNFFSLSTSLLLITLYGLYIKRKINYYNNNVVTITNISAK
jgi:hypothetical protein